MSNGESRPGHFLDLDGVRGVLANVVMLYHYGLNSLVATLTGGMIAHSPWGICVDFFFILSGFVLCHSMMIRPRSVREFFVSRVFRLLPLHLTILAVTVSIYSVLIPLGAWQILQNLLGVAVFTGAPIWNHPSWSMQLELYVPLVFFLYQFFLRVFNDSLALSVVCALLAGALQMWTSLELAIDESHVILRAIGGLSLGYFVYKIQRRMDLSFGVSSQALLPGLTVLYIISVAVSGVYPQVAISLPLLSVFIICAGVKSRSLLSAGVFRLMGNLSYAVYMLHAPALLIALQLLPGLDGNAPMKLALVAIVWIAAFGAMHLIERPGILLGRRVNRLLLTNKSRSVLPL